MKAADIGFQSIKGKDTVVSEQMSRFEILLKLIKSEVGIQGLLSCTGMLMIKSNDDFIGNFGTVNGTFVVRSISVATKF